MADEVHDAQKVQGRHRDENQARRAAAAPDAAGDSLQHRAAQKAHVVQGVHDAAEHAVDEHRVDATVARDLRALHHHEHLHKGKDHVGDRREGVQIHQATKRHEKKSQREQRIYHAEHRDEAEAKAHAVPQD